MNVFFRRKTINEKVRVSIRKFREDLKNGQNFSRITLNGLSSRTRILLIRELVAIADGQSLDIPFALNDKEFNIKLLPQEHQKGSGVVSKIGGYKDCVHPVISAYKIEQQTKFAKKLAEARGINTRYQDNTRDYHPKILAEEQKVDEKTLDLEMLDVLLDFEVVRRLIGTQDEENKSHYVKTEGKKALKSPLRDDKTRFAQILDSVPVGSALVGILKLSQLAQNDPNFVPLESFFYAPNPFRYTGFYFGDYNPFEGQAINNPRGTATKKIIRKLRGGDKAKPSTKETIHKEYLETFGGASESDGDDYDKKGEGDSSQDE